MNLYKDQQCVDYAQSPKRPPTVPYGSDYHSSTQNGYTKPVRRALAIGFDWNSQIRDVLDPVTDIDYKTIV